jgi:hypothetical protein
MSQDAITAVLFSPVGLGASACALLGLVPLMAPAPRGAIAARWSLGMVAIAVVLGVLALAMAGIGDAWHGAGTVILCAVAFAASAMWIAQAPLPGERGETQINDVHAADQDDGGGLGRPENPSPVRPSPGIDWDAFDRARASWWRAARPHAAHVG